MDIRQITPDYAVSPQIAPEDLPALKEAGFTTVICNRPDAENPMELQAEVLRAATEAAGLAFVENPVVHAALTMEIVEAQRDALDASEGPAFACCASDTRSTIVWALGQAGRRPTSEIIEAAAQAGYDLGHLETQLDTLAAR